AHTVAASCTDSNRVGVIGTKATIESEAYRDEIRKLAPGLKIFETACPVFVPLIEEGIINDAIMDLSIRHYLDDFLLENGIDTLVLGCTHYPLIKENIVRLYPDISVIDPSAEIIPSIADSLAKYGLLCDGTGTLKTPIQSVAEDGSRIGDRDARHGFDQRPLKAGHVFYASDLSENFVNMIEPIFEGSGFTVAFKNFDLEQAV
ncbi:MAG: aspartate/glutamate racemase family protein, partial [Clostridiales Family XIII bacterium]|nr:aspartate/glutamate racemase family protein [Clostridiales Family XIII bacterium]